MSLSSVANSAKRALDASNAKRGQLAIAVRRCSYHDLNKGRVEYTRLVLARVASVSHDGIAKELTVGIGGQTWVKGRGDFHQLLMMPAGFDAAGALTAFPLGTEWETIEAARDALRPFAA